MSRLRQNWERALGVAAAVGGAIAILIGWIGVSGSLRTFQQISYVISGGFFGLFLLGLGSTLWLSADQRDTWRKLDALEAKLTDVTPEIPEMPGPATVSSASMNGSLDLRTVR